MFLAQDLLGDVKDGEYLKRQGDGVVGGQAGEGSQGPPGPQGIQGPPGDTGQAGAPGPQGDQGPIGPAGIQGQQGAQGLQGIQGPQGPTGSTGSTGSAGPPGTDGAAGAEGAQGVQGNPGPEGPQGIQGVQGNQGTQGVPGEVPSARTISTTAPLTGGGDLSANRTLAVSAATTSAAGVVELATDGESASNVAVQGNDARMSNARTPTVHSIIGAQHDSFPGGTTNFLRADGTFNAPAGGSDPFLFKGVLASDVATGANVTPVSLTGLVFTFVANKTYLIEFAGLVQSAAATTGHGFQLDTSVAVTAVGLTFFHQLANAGTLSGGSSIADDASVGVSSGVPGTVDVPIMGGGILRSGANGGTAQLRHRSEVAAVSTVRAGFVMRVMQVN